jgi:hypothetical protein
MNPGKKCIKVKVSLQEADIAPSDIVHRPFDNTSSRREEIVHGR